jgi:hypothetical protein
MRILMKKLEAIETAMEIIRARNAKSAGEDPNV